MSGTSPAQPVLSTKLRASWLGPRARLSLLVLFAATLPTTLALAGAGATPVGLAILVAPALAWYGARPLLVGPARDRDVEAHPDADKGLAPADAASGPSPRAAEPELARLQRIHELVSAMHAAARRAGERETLLHEICTLAMRVGRYPLARVSVYDAAERAFVPLGAAGEDSPPPLRFRLDAAETAGIATRLLAGHAVVSDDLARDPLFTPVEPGTALHSCTLLPLRLGGEVIGVLGLYAADPGFFDTGEMAMLRRVEDGLTLCLEYLDKEEALHRLAYYDALTGLPNRVLFADRLDQALARERYWRRHVAVLMAHVDRFKELNSLHGHHVGDRLLRETAARLGHTVRTGDTIARTGTAAFGIILTDVAQPADAAVVARKIARAFEPPVVIDGREFYVTLGIGISVAPGDGGDTEALLRNADTALHTVGAASGTRYRLYTPEIDARVRSRFELERELRGAIERGELALHYQPIVELDRLSVIGAEALLRWHHPRLGTVAPDVFIPIAEQSGLIVPIGDWALRQACAQARHWHRLGLPSRIAINTSAIQLRDPDFDRRVQAVLGPQATADPPLLLALEITESNLMENAEQSAERLERLRGRGVAISIDDFGTGYSSLTYLKRLPVDTLKIDIGFVRDLTHDPEDAAIVRAIVALAHSLELTVVAEGIETPEQLALLRELGCDAAQGFFFSPAVTAERFESLSRTGFARVPSVQENATHEEHGQDG